MSRLIDADEFEKELSNIWKWLAKGTTHVECFDRIYYMLNNQPTAYNVDKVVEQIENLTSYYKDCTKYGNEDAEQQEISYGTTLNYEVASFFDDILEIVKRGGKE